MQSREKVDGDAFKETLQWAWCYNVRVGTINKLYCLFQADSDFVLKGKTINAQSSLSPFLDVLQFTEQPFSYTVF